MNFFITGIEENYRFFLAARDFALKLDHYIKMQQLLRGIAVFQTRGIYFFCAFAARVKGDTKFVENTFSEFWKKIKKAMDFELLFNYCGRKQLLTKIVSKTIEVKSSI